MTFKALIAVLRRPASQMLILLCVGVVLGWVMGQRYPLPVEDEINAKAHDPAVSCPERLRVVERDRRQMREELAYLKQSVIVEQEACFGTRQALREKEELTGDLNEQLAFYRGIVSPEENSLGVRVHRVDIYPVKGRVYQYRLTLLQPVRQGADAKGALMVEIEGLENERPKRYKLESLTSAGQFSSKYQFRYYTEVFGQFRLPDGLTPLRVKIELSPAAGVTASVSKTFIWEELIVPSKAKESGK